VVELAADLANPLYDFRRQQVLRPRVERPRDGRQVDAGRPRDILERGPSLHRLPPLTNERVVAPIDSGPPCVTIICKRLHKKSKSAVTGGSAMNEVRLEPRSVASEAPNSLDPHWRWD